MATLLVQVARTTSSLIESGPARPSEVLFLSCGRVSVYSKHTVHQAIFRLFPLFKLYICDESHSVLHEIFQTDFFMLK